MKGDKSCIFNHKIKENSNEFHKSTTVLLNDLPSDNLTVRLVVYHRILQIDEDLILKLAHKDHLFPLKTHLNFLALSAINQNSSTFNCFS